MQRDYCPVFRSINTSEKLAALPDDTCRLFYLLLLPQCDSWGRVTAAVVSLGAKVWPALEKPRAETARALAALEAVGLVHVHKLDAQVWIQVPDWEQKAGTIGRPDRRGSSEFPAPTPDSLTTKSGVSPYQVQHELGSAGTKSAQTRARESRGEEKREEQSRGEENARTRATPVLELAEQELPRELDRQDVRDALREYQACRRENGHKPLKETGWGQLLRKLTRWGPERAIAALEHSGQYQGVFEPTAASRANGRLTGIDAVDAWAARQVSDEGPIVDVRGSQAHQETFP